MSWKTTDTRRRRTLLRCVAVVGALLGPLVYLWYVIREHAGEFTSEYAALWVMFKRGKLPEDE